MLDIRFIRENPEVVRKDLEKRNEKEKLEWLEDLLKSDVEYRKSLQENQLMILEISFIVSTSMPIECITH